MFKRDVPWTIEQKAQVRIWYDEGLSSSEIAKKMGGERTRNSIIGMWHRENFPPRQKASPIKARIGRKPRPSRARSLNHRAPKAYSPSLYGSRNTDRQVVQPKPDMEEPKSLELTLMELTNSTCKYATSDDSPHLFCGNKVVMPSYRGARPWCEYHYAVVYRR